MPENLSPSSAPSPALARPRRFWQLGLQTFLLVVTTVALWMLDLANRQENERLEAQIKTMRPMARELEITDPSQIAIVSPEDLFSKTWDIYVPPGSFRLNLATYEIDNAGFPPEFQSAPLPPGRHRLTLRESMMKPWRITLLDSNTPVLDIHLPDDWSEDGSSGISLVSPSTSLQYSPDIPIVLYRRRLQRKTKTGWTSVSGPTNGVMFWIDSPSTSNPPPNLQ